MIAKFETSLGYIEVEINRDLQKFYLVNIIKNENFLKKLYEHEGGGLHLIDAAKKLYPFDEIIDWEDHLKKQIKDGKIWIGIELGDTHYGYPEYKLEL